MFLTARCSCSGNVLKLYILSIYWKLYIRSQLIAGSDRKNYRDNTMDNPLASIYGFNTYDTASETERTPVYYYLIGSRYSPVYIERYTETRITFYVYCLVWEALKIC